MTDRRRCRANDVAWFMRRIPPTRAQSNVVSAPARPSARPRAPPLTDCFSRERGTRRAKSRSISHRARTALDVFNGITRNQWPIIFQGLRSLPPPHPLPLPLPPSSLIPLDPDSSIAHVTAITRCWSIRRTARKRIQSARNRLDPIRSACRAFLNSITRFDGVH